MNFSDKLADLRRKNHHTQEQLADRLGVSRQAVSRWESGLAYPETDKLIRIAELYDCSLDYLLKEDVAQEKAGNASSAPPPFLFSPWFSFEYTSRRKIGSLPLVHICLDPRRTAKGFFALGIRAKGVFAAGVLSLGVVSFGVFSLGLLALGVFCLALLAFGSVAAGIVSFGAVALGLFAVGAVAVGGVSVGACAVGGIFAFGDHAYAPVAVGMTFTKGSLFGAILPLTAQQTETAAALLTERFPAFFSAVARWILSLI